MVFNINKKNLIEGQMVWLFINMFVYVYNVSGNERLTIESRRMCVLVLINSYDSCQIAIFLFRFL